MAEPMAHRAARAISIPRHTITGIVLPIPIVCFVGALVTDLVYRGSGGNLLWVNFSSWLLAAGLLFGALAGLIMLIDAVRGAGGWLPFGLLLAAWVVEFINSLVHTRDGWTAVVPLGLTLSAIAVVLILIGGWRARSRPAREGAGA